MENLRQDVRSLLINQWDYPEKQVDSVVNKILEMENSILESFKLWMATGKIPDVPYIHDCTPKMLNNTYPLKPPAIFMLLDWIRREPKLAFEALKDEYGRLPWDSKTDRAI